MNKRHNRHGSLFQQHTKAKLVENQRHLIGLYSYIHNNPMEAKLVDRLQDWPYSSYPDLTGRRNGDLPDRSFIAEFFASVEEFLAFFEEMAKNVPTPGNQAVLVPTRIA